MIDQDRNLIKDANLELLSATFLSASHLTDYIGLVSNYYEGFA